MAGKIQGRSIQLTEAGSAKIRETLARRNMTRAQLAVEVYGNDSNQGRIGQWLKRTRNIDEHYAFSIFATLGLKMQEGDDGDYRYSGNGKEFPDDRLPPWMQATLRYTVGREDEAANLAKRFKADGPRQAIAGMGGLGKTTLALFYAHQYAKRYAFRAFLDARSVAALEGEYLALASGIARASDTVARALTRYNNAPDSEELRAGLIQKVLAWFGETSGWLLILDNADCYAPISPEAAPVSSLTQEALGKLSPPPTANGHLLLTTRNLWFHDELDIRILPGFGPLKPADAEAFLLKRVAPLEELTEPQCEAMRRLARKLEYLPLALEQAAAQIKVSQDFANYERLFDEQGIGVLENADDDERTPYHSTLARTYQITFAGLKQNAPASADLFRLCSFLSPQSIPFEIILATDGKEAETSADFAPLSPADVNRCQMLLRPLRELALVKVDSDNKTFHLHSLVQRALRESLNAEERRQCLDRAVELIFRIFPNLDNGAKATMTAKILCNRLMPHVLSLGDVIEADVSQSSASYHLLRQAGCYLTYIGPFSFAERLLQQALRIQSALDPRHLDIAVTLKYLGDLNFRGGRTDTAKIWLEKAVQFYGDSVPEERRVEYAEAMSALGLALVYLDGPDSGEPLLKEALDIIRSILPNTDRRVAEPLMCLGSLSRVRGNHIEAESLYREALRILRHTFPDDHTDIAQTLNNLAVAYRDQGDYREARPLFEKAAEMYYRLGDFGGQALALCNLAVTCHKQGDYNAAAPLFEQAVDIIERVSDEDYWLPQRIREYRDTFLAERRQREEGD